MDPQAEGYQCSTVLAVTQPTFLQAEFDGFLSDYRVGILIDWIQRLVSAINYAAVRYCIVVDRRLSRLGARRLSRR